MSEDPGRNPLTARSVHVKARGRGAVSSLPPCSIPDKGPVPLHSAPERRVGLAWVQQRLDESFLVLPAE